MMQTPGPGDRPTMLGTDGAFGDGGMSPDPFGAQAATAPDGRQAQPLPAPPMSWGLANPTLPSQLAGWLRNYYGGVGSINEAVLQGLVQAAKQGIDPWNAAHADFGHGNDGLPDSGANLPLYGEEPPDNPANAVLGGMGTGPMRYGGGGDYSEPQPTVLGTVRLPPQGMPPTPGQQTWGRAVGDIYG